MLKMTGKERLTAMIKGERIDRIGISGWLHMPLVDHNLEAFVKETIDFTDNNQWDFVKLMPSGHYFAEAYGAEIEFLNNPKEWSGKIHKYPIQSYQDLIKLSVIEPKQNPTFKREIEFARQIVNHYQGDKPVLATIFTPLTWIQEMLSSTNPEPVIQLMQQHKSELHHALEVILATNLKLLDEFIDVGIDGIFLSTQWATSDLISRELLAEFCHPYDQALLNHIKGKTWFNLLHLHYSENLLFDEFVNYEGIHALNWENCAKTDDSSKLSSIESVRALFPDKVLIAGIDQHHDFTTVSENRETVKSILKNRLTTALKESESQKFIFAPGCALPLDVDPSVFSLLHEVVNEL
ncbi:MAG: hypothetical protein LKF42_06235 [Streptococcaceae bacterium]|jgi:uroporphyrinogen decarboxylase|nr:hypothetical protein [Streptococcaceae bacterium]MCH4177077.1 hypothetical protein [Streptococcaceae bacterium]